jgi:hypothetical protein
MICKDSQDPANQNNHGPSKQKVLIFPWRPNAGKVATTNPLWQEGIRIKLLRLQQVLIG